MDRIDLFRLFVRVVETGSFSRAALDLQVTQPTVTRQIAALEQRHGERLFNRNTRRLSLTEAGQRYYERCRHVLDAFEATEALSERAASGLSGRLRVATSVAFGRRVLTPVMLGFMREHPGLQLDLNLKDAYVDLVAEGVDVAVRLGTLADSSLVARRLGVNPWITVAAPVYLSARGEPRRPADLAAHNVLVYSTVNRDDRLHYTPVGGGAAVAVRVQGSLRANNLSALLAAVREGVGIAALPLYVAAASLAQGRVVPVLRQFALPAQEIHAVYPSARLVTAKVTALIAFLERAFAREDCHSPEKHARH